MKTIFLIIFAIVSVAIITTSSISILNYQTKYDQNCNSDGGYVVGFLRCTYIRDENPSPYEKYLDENNELNFGLKYDKNGMIIDDLQRIFDWCDYSGEKPLDWYFDWNNSTHHIDSELCEWELISNNTVTGSYELDEALCMGGRGYIVNDECERIGKYDPDTGLPIVENKEQCDMLEGSWDDKQNHCYSKYG